MKFKLSAYIFFFVLLSALNNTLIASKFFQIEIDSTLSIEKKIELKLKLAEDFKNSDVKKALTYAKEALHEAEKAGNKKWIGESKLAIGKCYEYFGVNIEALEHLTDALNIYNELNDSQKKAYALRQIGNIYYSLKEFDLAIKYFNEVFDCGILTKDTLLIIESLIGKGSVYGNTNRLDSSMFIFNRTFELAKKIGDKPTEVQSLFYIGDVFLFTNRPQKALEIFKLVEREYNLEEINSKLISNLYNSMTYAHIALKDLRNAKLCNKKVWELLQKYPKINDLMTYYEYKFQIDTSENKYKTAVEDHILYKNLHDSINNTKFKERLANFESLYKLEKKEREIEQLIQDNELKDFTIKQRRIANYGSITLVFLLFIIVFQILRSTKRTKQKTEFYKSREKN